MCISSRISLAILRNIPDTVLSKIHFSLKNLIYIDNFRGYYIDKYYFKNIFL